jgi:hypothetical protein
MASNRLRGVVSGRSAPFDKAVTVPAHVHVREVADELVILSLESEEYFGLDAVGTRMWQLLDSERTVQDAFAAMLEEFDVDEATLARDLEGLLSELSSRKLIELGEADRGRALDV